MRLFKVTVVAAIAFGTGLLPGAGVLAESSTDAENHSQLATGTDAPTRSSPATVKQKRSVRLPVSEASQRGIATPDHYHQSDRKKPLHVEEKEHRYFNKKQTVSDDDG